jgi:Flp pilus assembly pilin Flp
MSALMAKIRSLSQDETGATLMEYGLLLLFLVLVAVGSVALFGHMFGDRFNNNLQIIVGYLVP